MEASNPRGLILPEGVVQPFFLRFHRDDWHVMSLMEGHPSYEAVEAMVGRRPDGGWSVRAIVTRHDGSQVDHINDPALLAAMSGARREVCEREIAFSIDGAGPRPLAHLAFTSFAGEPVRLDLAGLGPPTARGAGLSDPGGHSADASLPLMWRGASTLAAQGTSVEVAGVRYLPPVKLELPIGVAVEGYLTRGHSMGVIRAGETRLKPARPIEGVSRTGAGETVTGRTAGDRFELMEVAIPDARGLAIRFADGRFDISVEGQAGLITGAAEADDESVVLRPEGPAWAVSRPVTATVRREGGEIVLATTVG
jgi:hypothetical protein